METNRPNAVFEEGPIEQLKAVAQQTGDNAFFTRMIGKFATSMEESMQQLNESFEQRDASQLQFYAHKMKGASATVGACRVKDLAFKLEMKGRSDMLDDECLLIRDQLSKELDLVLSHLRQI